MLEVKTTMEEATQVVNGITSTKYKLHNGGTLIIYRNPVTCYQQCDDQIAGDGNSGTPPV
jgi:hypothetical protein